jgi:hypothetical protein
MRRLATAFSSWFDSAFTATGVTRGLDPISAKIKASRVPDAVQRERQRSGAPLIRDLREGGVRNDPGSAAHHSASLHAAQRPGHACSYAYEVKPPVTKASCEEMDRRVKPAGDARERPRVATCRRRFGYCVCSPAIIFCRMRL